MPMSLTLDYNGSNIISYSATEWWITGFNPDYLNVQAGDLTATYAIDFSGNKGMFHSFYDEHYGTPGWSFDKNSYTAIYIF